MRLSELLHPTRIVCQQTSSSKKRTLETLSELLADAMPDFTDAEIFNSLITRERLGSTGLGNGVALPHGRMQGLKQPLAAMLVLHEGIDFDAIDGKPVDVLFALLVPEESTDDHLQILANLAKMFSEPEFCTRLRSCKDRDQCFALINSQESRLQLSA